MRTTPIPIETPRTYTRPIEVLESQIELVEVSTENYQEPLVVSTHGGPGSGKSRLLGTAPGSIGVIPMEHKARQSVLKAAAEFGRTVIMPDRDLIRVGNPLLVASLPAGCVSPEKFAGKNFKPEDMEKKAEREMEAISRGIRLDGPQPDCCARHYYRWHVNRVKSVAFRMAERDDIRTIGIDTFGQLVEDMLFANYGRTDKIMPLDKKSFNQEVRDFLNALTHKNLILTHHSSEVWVDNKPTKQTKPTSSFSKIGHYTSVAVVQSKNDKPRVGRDGNPIDPTWTLKVLDCQANTELCGLELLFDESITFSALAQLVYPDSTEEAWE